MLDPRVFSERRLDAVDDVARMPGLSGPAQHRSDAHALLHQSGAAEWRRRLLGQRGDAVKGLSKLSVVVLRRR